MNRLSFIIGLVATLAVGVADVSAQGRRDRGDGQDQYQGQNQGPYQRQNQGQRGWGRNQPLPAPAYGVPGPGYDNRPQSGSGRYRELQRQQQQQQQRQQPMQRSWNRGDRLPPGYGAMVPNPGAYRLRQPPPGYNWVQNGRDLYLTQQGTGLVLDAIPGGH